MADRIACSCVTCPKCGTWVVVGQRTEIGETKIRESCPVPECGKEFEFESGETRVFGLCTRIWINVHSRRLSGKRRIRSWWLPSAGPSAAGNRDRGNPDHGVTAP